MITINLLTGGQGSGRSARAHAQTVCVVLTCIVSAAYGAALQHSRGTLRSRSFEVETRLAESSTVTHEVEKMRKRRDELLKTLGAARVVLGERSSSSDFFEAVSRSLPDGVWLTEIRRSRVGVQLDGRAASLAEINGFVDQLDVNVPFARGPDLRSVSTDVGDDTDILRFQIVGELAPTGEDSLR